MKIKATRCHQPLKKTIATFNTCKIWKNCNLKSFNWKSFFAQESHARKADGCKISWKIGMFNTFVPGSRFTSFKTQLSQFSFGNFPMKNYESRAWWISAHEYFKVVQFHFPKILNNFTLKNLELSLFYCAQPSLKLEFYSSIHPSI